jgi:hypothetical protein
MVGDAVAHWLRVGRFVGALVGAAVASAAGAGWIVIDLAARVVWHQDVSPGDRRAVYWGSALVLVVLLPVYLWIVAWLRARRAWISAIVAAAVAPVPASLLMAAAGAGVGRLLSPELAVSAAVFALAGALFATAARVLIPRL